MQALKARRVFATLTYKNTIEQVLDLFVAFGKPEFTGLHVIEWYLWDVFIQFRVRIRVFNYTCSKANKNYLILI